jgi:hypothetical protein
MPPPTICPCCLGNPGLRFDGFKEKRARSSSLLRLLAIRRRAQLVVWRRIISIVAIPARYTIFLGKAALSDFDWVRDDSTADHPDAPAKSSQNESPRKRCRTGVKPAA